MTRLKLRNRLRFFLQYITSPPWDTGITPPELVEFVQTNPPGKALDLGCGTGTNAIYLAQNGWQVTGVDFISKAIKKARKKAKHASVSVNFQVGDVTELNGIIQQFDLILDIGCFHSLGHKEKAKYIKNLDRLLAPNGKYLLYAFFKDPNKESGPGITEKDIRAISKTLKLVNRSDGTERGMRPSAWFTFIKKGAD